MKNIKFSEFEIYLLKESLKNYKTLVEKEEFPKNSIITKDYIEMMINQLEQKLNEKSVRVKTKKLNATT